MSDNVAVKKKSQQAILNYISVNFQKMDVNNPNRKSSSETETSASRTPKEQRPKSTTSSSRGNNSGPQNRKMSASANSVTRPGNAPNPSPNPKSKCTPTNSTETRSNKTRTPPSIEANTNPQKKLMMDGITSRNAEVQLSNAQMPNTVTRSNEDTSTTRSNDDTAATRCNQQLPKQTEGAVTPRGNTEETTTSNSESVELVVVKNPMETDGVETNEMLDDLGPELAKMGRILAKEITKSLSNALIPLQNDIMQLHADTARLTQNENKVEELKLENENLHARVCKLELNNQLLKRKLGKLEDQFLDNNLLFSGIREENGETEMSRYQAILDIISTTFVGADYQMQLNQAKQIRIEKLERKGRYVPNRIRPISVAFTHHCDVLDILAKKRYLPEGIYVNQEYGEETEKRR